MRNFFEKYNIKPPVWKHADDWEAPPHVWEKEDLECVLKQFSTTHPDKCSLSEPEVIEFIYEILQAALASHGDFYFSRR